MTVGSGPSGIEVRIIDCGSYWKISGEYYHGNDAYAAGYVIRQPFTDDLAQEALGRLVIALTASSLPAARLRRRPLEPIHYLEWRTLREIAECSGRA